MANFPAEGVRDGLEGPFGPSGKDGSEDLSSMTELRAAVQGHIREIV